MNLKLLIITALSTFSFSLNACPKPPDTTLTQQYETGALQWQIVRKEIDPNTLIHKAILENAPEVINFLLEHGVKVDYADENGMTPLMVAILNRSSDIVNVLLAHGASTNPSIKWNNMTLLELAISMHDAKVIRLLVENSADFNEKIPSNPLYKVINLGMLEVAASMINAGADIHSDSFDSTLMQAVYIARGGDTSLLELLLQEGANINQIQKQNGKEINTPLLQAVFSNDLPLVKLLVEYGADVNQSINFYGYEVRTPLKHALANGRIEIVQYLLQNGARG
jgi:ankyrin repeat protein